MMAFNAVFILANITKPFRALNAYRKAPYLPIEWSTARDQTGCLALLFAGNGLIFFGSDSDSSFLNRETFLVLLGVEALSVVIFFIFKKFYYTPRIISLEKSSP